MVPPLAVEWPKVRYFDDFYDGLHLVHHWGRTLTEADNVIFTTATMSFNPSYFNVEYARAMGHERCVANPYLVLLTIIGLSVQDLSESGGAFLGMTKVAFHQAAYAGDTLYGESEVLSHRPSASRPGFGIVTWHTTGRRQDGAILVDFERSNLLPSRPDQNGVGARR